MPEKLCKKCKTKKELTKENWYFYRGKFRAPCYECRKSVQKKYRQDERDREFSRKTWDESKETRDKTHAIIDGIMGDALPSNPYHDAAQELREHTLLMIKAVDSLKYIVK